MSRFFAVLGLMVFIRGSSYAQDSINKQKQIVSIIKYLKGYRVLSEYKTNDTITIGVKDSGQHFFESKYYYVHERLTPTTGKTICGEGYYAPENNCVELWIYRNQSKIEFRTGGGHQFSGEITIDRNGYFEEPHIVESITDHFRH